MFINANTGVFDANGIPIKNGDHVKVNWLDNVGIAELDCEAKGFVRYMPDGVTAGFMVVLDPPYKKHFSSECSYEIKQIQLTQVPENGRDESNVTFEII